MQWFVPDPPTHSQNENCGWEGLGLRLLLQLLLIPQTIDRQYLYLLFIHVLQAFCNDNNLKLILSSIDTPIQIGSYSRWRGLHSHIDKGEGYSHTFTRERATLTHSHGSTCEEGYTHTLTGSMCGTLTHSHGSTCGDRGLHSHTHRVHVSRGLHSHTHMREDTHMGPCVERASIMFMSSMKSALNCSRLNGFPSISSRITSSS